MYENDYITDDIPLRDPQDALFGLTLQIREGGSRG